MTKKISILALFIYLFILHGFSQQIPLDTVSREQLNSEQQKAIITNWIEKSCNSTRWSHDARMKFALSAYNFSHSEGYESLKMNAMFCLSELYLDQGRFDDALLYFDTLVSYAHQTQNPDLLIKVKNHQGTIYRLKGEMYNALGITYDALHLARENNNTSLKALSANNIGIIYRNLGENNTAISYYREALEDARLAGDTSQVINSKINIGNYYWFLLEAPKAFEYYEIAWDLAVDLNHMEHMANLQNNLGNIQRANNRLDSAIVYYERALDALDDLNIAGLRAVTIRNIGVTHQKKENLQKALDYVYQSLEISQNVGLTSLLRNNYLTLSEIYHAKGNTSQAYNYLVLYKELNEQIFNNQLLNRITYFSEQIYDAQRKEELYKFRLERNILILAIVVLGLVFFVVLYVVIYRRFKDKRAHIAKLKSTLEDKNITEKALRQSEENYQTLIKTLNEGLIVLDKNQKIEFLNYKACRIFGVSHKSELQGEGFEKFLLTQEDLNLYKEKIELQKMGISDHYEVKMKNVAGDVMWVNLSSAPILDENLKATGSVTLVSDVTERKKSEQAYGELTANLNQKIKQLNCLYDISDLSGVPGISFEEIIEKSLEIIPVGLKFSHDAAVKIEFDNKVYASKNFKPTPWAYTVPIKVQKKKLGYLKVVYLEEKPNINNDPFHFNEKILLKNISEKFGQIVESKILEKNLRENQKRLQEIQKIARVGDWEKDIATGKCTFSETFFDIAEITPEKTKFFEYSKFLEIIHPDDKETFLRFENELLNNKPKESTVNFRIITNTGIIKHIYSSGKIIHKEDPPVPIKAVFTIQDVSEQKYNQELQYNAEVSLKTSQAKQQVLANMSYEMRTPITGILGMVDFLMESKLNKKQTELANTIKESSNGLLGIINNILDLHRIESGKFRLNNNTFNLSAVVERIHSLFNVISRSKDITLKAEVDSRLPQNLISDETRIYQVITSFVSLIVKNSKQGLVNLSFKQESLIGQQLVVLVEISDNCSELDYQELKVLLNPGNHYENLHEKQKDSNLVLAISGKIVELLGGSISIDKIEPRGNLFCFTFFASLAEEDKIIEETSSDKVDNLTDFKGLKVLCVEDKKINQKVISLMLTHVNCRVELANNGKEAIEMLEKERFDIILLDMIMPVMDGLQTIKYLKSHMDLHPPVIALTANVMEEDKKKYFDAGIDDYLTKPINTRELYRKIARWHHKFETRLASNNYN